VAAGTRRHQSLDDALYDCEDKVLDVLEGERLLTRSASGHRFTCEMETLEDGRVVPKFFEAHSIGDLDHKDLIAMSGMPPEEWKRLVEESETLYLKRNDLLYRNGDLCKEVYILVDGCIKLKPANSWSAPRQVTALGLIGAEALIMRQALREETAQVISEGAMVHKLTQEKLQEMRETKKDLYISFTELRARALCTSRGPAPPL